MRYVEARIDEYSRDEAYRIFVTKSLQLAPQNKYFTTTSYTDLLKPVKVDSRTSDDIASDIMLKAGLKFKG